MLPNTQVEMESSELLDKAFEALSHRDRRLVIEELRDAQQLPVTREKNENTSLIHVHLPKLSDYEFIECTDRGAEVVVERGRYWDEISEIYDDALGEIGCEA